MRRLVLLMMCLCVLGCKKAPEDNAVIDPTTIVVKDSDISNTGAKYAGKYLTIDGIKHKWETFWGYVPESNHCVKCGEFSVDRFCTSCGTERKESYIGIYCPQCNPKGDYSEAATYVGIFCPKCGTKKTWKLIPPRN